MALDARFDALSDHIPEEIRSHLTGITGAAYRPTSRPASVFRLAGERDEDLYLKVLGAHDAGFNSLRDEALRLEWLGERLPVPKVVAFASRGLYEFLLTKSVPGVPAHDRSAGRSRQEVASLAGWALKVFHSVPTEGCPFRHPVVGPTGEGDEVLVHGDYCLPNVLLDGDRFHYLDVGQTGIGDRYVDVVAAIWSLRHNYGKGSAAVLLDEYGLRTPDLRKLAAYWRWWNSL